MGALIRHAGARPENRGASCHTFYMANDNSPRPALVALPSVQDPIEQAYMNLFLEITRGIKPNFERKRPRPVAV